MAPILTTFTAAIKTTIDGLTTTGGYNLNWGGTNVVDRAHIDDSKYGASAIIEPLTGESTEDIESPHANAYGEIVEFRIRVRVPLIAESMTANTDIVTRFFLAKDDLKKAFRDQNINDRFLMFTRWEIDYKENGDVFLPHEMSTYWQLDYTHDRENPEQAGDV